MSFILKIIITSFVFIDYMRIGCQSYAGSNDCFRYCSNRHGMLEGRPFRSCMRQCHNFEQQEDTPPMRLPPIPSIKRQPKRPWSYENSEESEDTGDFLHEGQSPISNRINKPTDSDYCYRYCSSHHRIGERLFRSCISKCQNYEEQEDRSIKMAPGKSSFNFNENVGADKVAPNSKSSVKPNFVDCYEYCSSRHRMEGRLFTICLSECNSYVETEDTSPVKSSIESQSDKPSSNENDEEDSDQVLQASWHGLGKSRRRAGRREGGVRKLEGDAPKPRVSDKPKEREDKRESKENKRESKDMPVLKEVQPHHCGLESVDDIVKKEGVSTKELGRVMGGIEADPYEFPWIASIQYKNKNTTVHFCGGSIITKNHIVTAAHCMERFIGKEKSMVIKIGVNSHKQPSVQNLIVMKVVIHEGWDPTSLMNDIAIIKVKPDIKFSTTSAGKFIVNAVCLPSTPTEPNGEAVVAGWGEQISKSGISSEWLQKVTVPIADRLECKNAYIKHLEKFPESKVKVTDLSLCAGGDGDKDACRGDSGGGLIQVKDPTRVLYGLVSFNVDCGIKDIPTIYTNVVRYLDWINRSVNNIKSKSNPINLDLF